MRRNSILVCALLGVMIAGQSMAADIRYMGNGDYLVAANWVGGVVPGAADTARMNWGNNTVTLSGLAPDINHLQTGVDEPGALVINSGGSLTSLGWTMIGTAGAVTGRLTINNGGVMNINSHLWSGVSGSTGITDINSGGILNVGGILGLGTVDAVNPSGGFGFLNVNDGGVLHLSNIQADGSLGSIQPSSLLDIDGSGLVTIPGDFTAVMNTYITAGRITGNDVVNQVQAIFDVGQNMTFLTAIAVPEPSAFALMALMGAGLVVRRLVRRG